MQERTRIVIVDDHAIVRELLKYRLMRMESRSYEVVGESANGRGAMEISLECKPQILLLDLILPGLNGVDVLRQLQPKLPQMRVIFFSGSTRLSLLADAIELGARGFVSKLRSWQTLLDAVDLVAAGGSYFDPVAAGLFNGPRNGDGLRKLTPREREFVQLIAESRTTKEIADVLGISLKTADKHRTHMMEKLNLHDSAAVTRFAVQSGMISLD